MSRLDDAINNKDTRRTALLVFALVVPALLAIDVFLISEISVAWAKEILSGLIRALVAGLGSSVLIAFTLRFLAPPPRELAPGIILLSPKGKQISRTLKDAMVASKSWQYSGSLGSYFRAVTLPTIAKSSLEHRAPRNLHALILDPADDKLCERYAKRRSTMEAASGSKRRWTKEDIRNEVLATAITCYTSPRENSYLNVKVRMRNHDSQFRYDLSDTHLIITTEHKTAPALMIKMGNEDEQASTFYNSYNSDMTHTFESAREADGVTGYLDDNRLDTLESLTTDHVKGLAKLIMPDVKETSEESAACILKHIVAPEDRYG